MNIFGPDMQSGKMCLGHSAATKGKILEPSWKCLQELKNQKLLFLNLTESKNGQNQVASSLMAGQLHGDLWMLNFGEFPNEERESHLSQILQDKAPQKYYLSKRACEGILRRAKERGKELPEILEKALMNVILSKSEADAMGGGKGPLIQNNKSATLATHNDQTLFSYGISSKNSNAMKSSNPHSGIYEADTSRTLDINGENPTCNQGGIIIAQKAYDKWKYDDKSATLKASGGSYGGQRELSDKCGTILARDYKGVDFDFTKVIIDER